jgi:hypothetical protein
MSETFDIAVVGGGAAGIAAAVSSARAGCKTLLLDRHSAAGGTGGFSGLTTLCGLFDDEGGWINDGFAREFAGKLSEAPPLQMGKVWVLPYRPEAFLGLATSLLASTPNLHPRWNIPLVSAVVEGNHIVSLNDIKVRAVIDCSGTAEVARLVGAACLETDETTQAPAVIFPLSNVRRELKTSADVMQVLLPLARAGLPSLSFQPNPEPNTFTVKFAGQPDQVPQVIKFLQNYVTGFEDCRTTLTEFTSAQRAGRMIIGQYVLTGADVLAARKFSDSAARCAWPIEQWDAEGHPKLRYLPKGAYYEIPLRSLRAQGTQNLFMAGKVISADVDGIASARVMGCCLATGAAAGHLAAEWLASAVNK